MKIMVPVKRVVDFNTSVRVKADGSAIETAQVKWGMNPFDAIALEEALRLREVGKAEDILAVSMGGDASQEILRTALAMGADRAVLVRKEGEVEPLAAAKMLQALVSQEKIDLVLLGKQAIDSDNNQTGQMLAGLLRWPQATFASKIVLENNTAEVTREIDGGLETLRITLPAVITTDLRLNEPRYISLPNIVQAKRKTITVIAAESLGLDIAPRQTILKYATPERRRAGTRVADAAELVRKLRTEAQVLS